MFLYFFVLVTTQLEDCRALHFEGIQRLNLSSCLCCGKLHLRNFFRIENEEISESLTVTNENYSTFSIA